MSNEQDTIMGVSDLRKSFGGVHALDGASLIVRRNTLTGLIGPNGSGKTTLFNVSTGLLKKDPDCKDGCVTFENSKVDGLATDEISLRGMVRTFQRTRIFPEMTVLENMLLHVCL